MKKHLFIILFTVIAFITYAQSNSTIGEEKESITFNISGVTFKMIPVAGGTFTMGATAEQGSDALDFEKPVHSVSLSDFYMGETEVTQALWKTVMGTEPQPKQTRLGTDNGWASNIGKGNDYPAYSISWDDCQEFIAKLNYKLAAQLNGKVFALPTEAEWEYAARGGQKSKGYKYSGSNTIGEVAWILKNSRSQNHPVAQKQANELGLYDMSGNVSEWCADRNGKYSISVQTNPTGPTSGSFFIYRGGSHSDSDRSCRVSSRNSDTQYYRDHHIGLRLMLRCESENKQITVSEGPTSELCLTLNENGSPITFKMIPIKGGTFTMGATSEMGIDVNNDEKPTHEVTLSDFYMGETEVTQALWKAVMNSNPSNKTGDNLPVENMSWDNCLLFINRLNSMFSTELGNKIFALPTEAEWEYAARGGQKSKGYKYSGSNTIEDVAWYWNNSGNTTQPVAQKQPNELGLYDMTGNVWEWCEDWYGNYISKAQTDPTGYSSGFCHVSRGSSYKMHEDKCRVSIRDFGFDTGVDFCGLRLVLRTPSQKAKLTISCSDNKADIFVNDEKKTSGSWAGDLDPGTYVIEARKVSHRTVKQTISLAKWEQKTITLDAPQPIYGELNLQSSPANCDVYIDGKKAGKSSDHFSNLLIGNHKVELKCEGYESASKQVTINEGQTSELSFTLNENPPLTFTVSGVTFKMLPVIGGTFTMGATDEQGKKANEDEKPPHGVTLNFFYIGETEVTQALWQAVMGDNPSLWSGDNLPVENVNWDDCQAFIDKLNSMLSKQLNGKKFSLPTEAQWEYAARGGLKSQGYKFSGSNDIGDVAWYKKRNKQTQPVAQKRANELGLYDMSGNVGEWCSDWYNYNYYSSSPTTNPTGPSKGTEVLGVMSRVSRGGNWDDHENDCRVSCRNSNNPSIRLSILGLRLLLQ